MPIGARSKTLLSWKIKMPKMTMRLGESPLTHCMLSRICANHKIQSLLLGTTSERKKSFYFITLTPSQSVWNALFIGVSVVRVSVRASFYPHTLTIRLKCPVYQGFKGVRVKIRA